MTIKSLEAGVEFVLADGTLLKAIQILDYRTEGTVACQQLFFFFLGRIQRKSYFHGIA